MISNQMFLDMVGAHATRRFRRKILPVIDYFAGLGGTSTGLILAFLELGLKVQIAAVNHWRTAIMTHELNHPGHIHFETNVDKVDLDDLLSETDSDGIFFLAASPTCTTHSQARGGTPINPQSRSDPQAVIRCLRKRRAVHVLVENVPPFIKHGPLMQKRTKAGVPIFLRKNAKGQWKEFVPAKAIRPKGWPARKWWKQMEEEHGLKPALIPDPKRLGEYFQKWVHDMRRLGYDVEWRVVNAADFGCATKRPRLFVQAVLRASGRKIVWPNPTHGPKAEPTGEIAPWRTARSIINWNLRGESIFEKKRPLADKTIDRIAVGIMRYGLEPCLIKFKGTGTANSIDAPIDTIQANGNHYGLCIPKVTEMILPQHRGYRDEIRVKSVDEPFDTLTGKGAEAVVTATASQFIVPNFGERPTQEPRTHSADAPLPAITSHGAGAVVSTEIYPSLVVCNHGNGKEGDKANERRARTIDEPLDAITGSNSLALITGNIRADSGKEKPAVITDWKSLSAVLKAGVKRARREKGYRPLVSFQGHVFRLDAFHRMVNWKELALASSFPDSYQFLGTDADKVKMIGNAVPPLLARALAKAMVSQNPNVGRYDTVSQQPFPMAA